MNSQITELLMHWHVHINNRLMPWKGEKDPYKIWLSEIILQQTRVEQGLAYYQKFIQNYSTIQLLAAANDADVFKLWEGLGYYNRCKNLLITARYIANELGGIFPDSYNSLIQLKGIGSYTAAAIASFAYNLSYAVVDGNVFRVLARVFGIETPTDSSKGKQLFAQLANDVLDKANAGRYNQAIMDFGATVCKPFGPLCNTCVLAHLCKAYNEGKVNYLPIKVKTIQKKKRFFYYFIFELDSKILVHKRVANDIWQSLFEFYLVESPEQILWNETNVGTWLQQQLNISVVYIKSISTVLAQQLTHQQLKGQFIHIQLQNVPPMLQHYQWCPISGLPQLAFPKFINQYLETVALGATESVLPN